MGNSKYKQSSNTQDDSDDPTDSEEPPGPASRQAQNLHWSPGPTTPSTRMRQTPVNNVCNAANIRREPGSNAQEHPRSPPEALGRVPKPTSMTSTRMLGQTETAPATRPARENELADTLATTNREALSPRTGIHNTTPTTIGEASHSVDGVLFHACSLDGLWLIHDNYPSSIPLFYIMWDTLRNLT